MTFSTRDVTDRIVAALVADGLEVGDAVAPDGGPPYVVVWPSPTGGMDGPIGTPHADEPFAWQFTCVGLIRQQAQGVQDAVRRVLLDGWRDLDFPAATQWRPPQWDVGDGLMRDDDTAGPPLFVAHPRIRFFLTPSPEEAS